MIKLGSIADIVSGRNVARLPESEKSKKYTNADFESDFYRMKLASPTSSIIYQQSSTAPHMVATILSDENKNKFISQVFSIIKVDTTKVNPWYLCYLLNQSRQLKRQYSILLQGSVIARLSAQQLKQVEIELPYRDKQEKIGTMYATALYQHYLEVLHADSKLKGIMAILRNMQEQ